MCKAENGLSGPVFPLDDSSEEEISVIKQHLQNAGFSRIDQKWLVDVFKRPDCFGDPNEVSEFRDGFMDLFEQLFPKIVEKLTEVVQTEKDCQTRLALLFSCMLNLGTIGYYPTWFLPNTKLKESDGLSDSPEWATEFQKHARFCPQSLNLDQLTKFSAFEKLLPFLLTKEVPLSQLVNLDRLDPIPRRNWSSNDRLDSEELEFWLVWRFGDNEKRSDKVKLGTLLADFSSFPDDVLGDKILGLLNTIDNAMMRLPPEKRLDPLNDGWEVVARELIPFLEFLTEKQPELSNERSSLLKAWWRLSQLIYGWSNGGLESELSGELRNRLVESASRHIGILRSVLRDTPEVFESEDSPGSPVSDFYQKAFYALLVFAEPWKRLKPLLLAFTEMNAQAVASHLSFWNESGQEDPPYPYSQIPLWIGMSMYPQHLQNELQKDPHLQNLREEFAKFCLERLRTKEKNKNSGYANADFIEPRPAWRLCYVQALAALRVNPGGRAHRTLFWLLNNDPDETVKELAKRAHKQIRHLDRRKPNLDEGASPRRPLFEAFWWLRQAHLMTLDVEIDRAGAMRTRRKELHRTREKDDRYEWKR
ncbi:MAG: hypothetical protein OXN25_00205 [Candidatus Poribacteria bacterium]|nr:hypothetical protein [Candidatus Poribacteria bacterium]